MLHALETVIYINIYIYNVIAYYTHVYIHILYILRIHMPPYMQTHEVGSGPLRAGMRRSGVQVFRSLFALPLGHSQF